MKVYVVTEGSENTIRLATLRKDIAEHIVESFDYLSLKINELDLVGCDR